MPFVYKTHYYVLPAHIRHAGIEREKSKLKSQSLSMAATKEQCLEKKIKICVVTKKRNSTGVGGKRFKI